jgi:hypothetical protein
MKEEELLAYRNKFGGLESGGVEGSFHSILDTERKNR